ncbi:C-terminal binding protein [Falsiroseomonas selenitidurans]|uniref:C-terminal binding protein n=1 Tax=Falsiroseomonas selenitidurans TaxID=2716335 RepID=A0ABX1E497_9PROT|nr:C-terminal binding protein [Falsiroseomonas selenitidurans]NKC31530.1 C-terminal binding protein [Falsiroseomonas selenitidurans]
MRVVILDDGYDHYEAERAILAPLGASLVLSPCRGDAAAVRAALAGADAALVRESPVDAAAFAAAPGLRGLVRYGVGVDNIDLAAAAARRIPVCNVPDYGVEEVSDHALALLLAAARRLPMAEARVRSGGWGVPRAAPVFRLAGGTLGLIGLGRIGSAFLRKARALGFARVLIADPGLRRPPEGCELADALVVAEQADAISLHAPATPATRHIVDHAFLVRMKRNAVLVNTSRGALVDEAALAAALHKGLILGAGLDVFEVEPLPADSPLRGAPNLILTDHAAWYSEAAIVDLQRKAAEEIARMLRGEVPRHQVNRWE